MLPRLRMLAAIAALLVPSAFAQTAGSPVAVSVLTEAPDAIVHFSYNGKIGLRALPTAIVETGGDLGTQRVTLKMNDKGIFEGDTFLNRPGSYFVRFEGQDLTTGTRLRDDNDGKNYPFEVTTLAERNARENALRNQALKSLRKALPDFATAEVFFNNRQPADARVAIVRAADGLSVYRVRVSNGGTRKVTVLEQVK